MTKSPKAVARRRKSRPFHPKTIYVEEDSHLGGHGAAVLLLVREGAASNWTSLCKVFGYDSREYHSGHLELRSTIQELIEANLISSQSGWKGPYEVTDRCHEVQHALGISLPQVANLPSFSGLAVQPFFGKPELWDVGWHVFVLMPFEPALDDVYNHAIKNACKTLQVTVARADDIFSASEVIGDVTEAIYNSAIIIADCTNRNPNVFYELGISHTFGKKVVLISQRREDVPFDVSYIRYITYEPSVAGLRRLQGLLVRTLREEAKGIWR